MLFRLPMWSCESWGLGPPLMIELRRGRARRILHYSGALGDDSEREMGARVRGGCGSWDAIVGLR